MRKILFVSVAVALLMPATISTAFAAQGQITEVNPSGLTKAHQATNGHVGQVISKSGAAGVFSDDTFTTCISIGNCY